MLSARETRQLERLAIRGSAAASPAAATGLRHAAATGHGLDFHDFRHYQPGDDPRRIDWTVAARHRQLVVRQFRAEGHVRLHVLIDVSRSMTIGAPSKLDVAIKLAAALSYIASEHGDAVGVTTFDDRLVSHVPTSGGRPQLLRVLEALRAAGAGRESDIDRALQQYGGLVRGPGLVVVLSDFFQPDLSLDGARYLLYRGLTPALVQIVADEEIDPAIDDGGDDAELELIDIERPDAAGVIVGRSAVSAYRERMTALGNQLSGFCSSRGLPWLRIAGATPFERLLSSCVHAGLLATAV